MAKLTGKVLFIYPTQQRGESPACCLLSEIMNELREDVTECFRQLHYDGEFRASATVNKIPMLLRK